MKPEKPWRAVVNYRGSAYLVGFFDSAEEAQKAATWKARSHSEEPVRSLEVDTEGWEGKVYRQYWRGRRALGDWFRIGSITSSQFKTEEKTPHASDCGAAKK